MPPLESPQLSNEHLVQFNAALIAAYPQPFDLDQMLQFNALPPLAHLSNLGLPTPQIVFQVISKAEAQGWTQELLLGARRTNPGNPLLIAFAQEFNLAPGVYDLTSVTPAVPLTQAELEKLVVRPDGVVDVNAFLMNLGRITQQVCRVEFPPKTAQGTGFLVGPSAVLTNFHVIESIKSDKNPNGTFEPKHVRLRFDYKADADGVTVSPGKEYRLAADWLIDSSPYSPVDREGKKPEDDELDYALLRVDGTPGNEAVGPAANGPAPTRGWVKMPLVKPDLTPGRLLYIVQHPKGNPLKVGANIITEGGFADLRVRYKTNTDEGSSGSPCFDARWNLVALHHMGDPSWEAQFNQGIPITAIEQLMELDGVDTEKVFGK